MEKRPWLDYTGQSTAELLAHKDTHRIDSIVSAFEQAIQRKSEPTEEERVVLAIEALEREVNNGGYHQFFFNSSRQYAPIVVDCLRRAGCGRIAELTAKAIAALRVEHVSAESVRAEAVREDRERDAQLDALDREFYTISEIAPKLLAFIEAHREKIQIDHLPPPPPPKLRPASNLVKIFARLSTAPAPERTPEQLRQFARDVAKEKAPGAADDDIEGAAVLYEFTRSIKGEDFAASEQLCRRAYELARQESHFAVALVSWMEKLIAAGRHEQADASMVQFLEFLKTCEPSEWLTNNLRFCAKAIRKHPGLLRRCEAFLL